MGVWVGVGGEGGGEGGGGGVSGGGGEGGGESGDEGEGDGGIENKVHRTRRLEKVLAEGKGRAKTVRTARKVCVEGWFNQGQGEEVEREGGEGEEGGGGGEGGEGGEGNRKEEG